MAVNLSLVPMRIKKIRTSLGLTQKEFAKSCGMQQAQISAYEMGKAYPTLESALKICGAGRVSISALVDENDVVMLPTRRATKEEMALWIIDEIGVKGKRLEYIEYALSNKGIIDPPPGYQPA